MPLLGSSEAAEAIGVSSGRVRQLAASGSLRGEKVGASWVFRERDVEDFVLRRRPRGRPLSAAVAWATLAEIAGRDTSGFPDYVRTRARRHAQRSLRELQPWLRNRAEERRLCAHPSAVDALREDPRVVLGGDSAAANHGSLLVSPEGAVTLYVRRRDVDGLCRDHGLVEPSRDGDANVCVLAVADDVWPFDSDERFAWRPVVVIDLLDASRGRDRLRAAVEELLASGQRSAVLTGPVGSRLREHRDQACEIVERHGAERPRVFGSVARGDDRDDSDLDLLVRAPRGFTLIDQAAIARELRELLGTDVDVVTEGALDDEDARELDAQAVPL